MDTIPALQAESTARLIRWSRNPEVTPCSLEVDNHLVPYVEIAEVPNGHNPFLPDGVDPEGVHWELTVHRPGGHNPVFGIDVYEEAEVLRWAEFVAHAMAVAAGASSHGRHSQRFNPHGSGGIVLPATS